MHFHATATEADACETYSAMTVSFDAADAFIEALRLQFDAKIERLERSTADWLLVHRQPHALTVGISDSWVAEKAWETQIITAEDARLALSRIIEEANQEPPLGNRVLLKGGGSLEWSNEGVPSS